MSMEVSKWLVSWFITYLEDLLTTYLYRGYNPVAKYRGHPSMEWLAFGWCLNGREGIPRFLLAPQKRAPVDHLPSK